MIKGHRRADAEGSTHLQRPQSTDLSHLSWSHACIKRVLDPIVCPAHFKFFSYQVKLKCACFYRLLASLRKGRLDKMAEANNASMLSQLLQERAPAAIHK